MIEAKVECLCGGLALPDLGLVGDDALTRGQVLYLGATKARASQDLQRAWRARGVSLKYVERYRERREAPPHPMFQPPAQSRVAAPLEPEDTTEHDLLLVDLDAIVERVVAELEQRQSVREDRLVARITDSVLAAMKVQFPEGLPVGGRGLASSAGRVPVEVDIDADVPVFVPSKIGDDLTADLGVTPEQADEGSVSAAAAALRATRKAGKKGRTEKRDG